MAFDGITVAAIVSELNRLLIDGRIFKIKKQQRTIPSADISRSVPAPDLSYGYK